MQRFVKRLAVAAWLCVGVAGAQDIAGLPAPAKGKGHVTYASEVVEVAAGKPVMVELHFRVDEGFHVNSHTPSSDLLIATGLKLDAVDGVKVLDVAYPKGSAFHLPQGGGEMLDVYQGEFRVVLRVVVPKGQNTLTGGLRYQACDNTACFPARTLPVTVAVTGK
jgi:hypothetical protein